jgi:hypothetical protein
MKDLLITITEIGVVKVKEILKNIKETSFIKEAEINTQQAKAIERNKMVIIITIKINTKTKIAIHLIIIVRIEIIDILFSNLIFEIY